MLTNFTSLITLNIVDVERISMDMDMDIDNEEEYLSLSKAAEILGVTTKTIRNWDDKGKIRTVRTPGNHRRIPISEVTRLLQEERLKPGEMLAELQQESETFMGDPEQGGIDWKLKFPKIPTNTKSVTITPSEYKAHLRLFGLDDVEGLSLDNTELHLTPELNIEGELNRDELTHFTRLLIHKIEDILNSRLTDSEYTKFSNMVANIHERANGVATKTATRIRPGKPAGVTPGINNSSKERSCLGFLEN